MGDILEMFELYYNESCICLTKEIRILSKFVYIKTSNHNTTRIATLSSQKNSNF